MKTTLVTVMLMLALANSNLNGMTQSNNEDSNGSRNIQHTKSLNKYKSIIFANLNKQFYLAHLHHYRRHPRKRRLETSYHCNQ